MERYVCIHGHFYQPPRENPWLEAIEVQDSAYPYHDWNERVTAECYAPNSAARSLDGEGRIAEIVSNYARISFNFGPTVLSWMERFTPHIHQAIVDADRLSRQWRSGHGNALAQVYNHIIMPLASERDKRTQVRWGIRDFEQRFGRFPEGMWLAETAVDIATLEVLAEEGIGFTILAPRQAARIRQAGSSRWKDVSGGRIDPSRAYLCRLPSGRCICIFFYDGPISQGVAFEKLLNRGEDFANRLVGGFSSQRRWPQLLHIATDGETYGHHHRFGDMALAHALNYIEVNGLARLTNYGEFLDLHPPTHEVQIFENSSWSCAHGIERWRSDCGCNSGGRPGWNQGWRAPLRRTLDWLRDELSVRFERQGGEYLADPWQARDEFIQVILDRSPECLERFIDRHARRKLDDGERTRVLKLLEIQRHALLMYTSCGWFFDDLSGIETVQIIQYAGRALQLADELPGDSLEQKFVRRLAQARSNLPEQGDGAQIYRKLVRPAKIDLKKVGVHYAVSSLFEEYGDHTEVFSYRVTRQDYRKIRAGRTRLAVGRICATSQVTGETECMSFCIIHLGGHALNGGVRVYQGEESYLEMKKSMVAAFEKGAFVDIIRLMDQHFGMHNYSIGNLFRDEQRRILKLVIDSAMKEIRAAYRDVYDNNRILMGFIRETGMPVPKAFLPAAELTLNHDIRKAFSSDWLDVDLLQQFHEELTRWDVPLDTVSMEYLVRQKLEGMLERLARSPADHQLLIEVRRLIELLKSLPVEVNYWQAQNVYYRMAKSAYEENRAGMQAGSPQATEWIHTFTYIGQLLGFNTAAVLPGG